MENQFTAAVAPSPFRKRLGSKAVTGERRDRLGRRRCYRDGVLVPCPPKGQSQQVQQGAEQSTAEPVQPKPKLKVKIVDDVLDAHDGQVDGVLTAHAPDGTTAGQLSYAIFDRKPHIQLIEVGEQHRGRGVADKLVEELVSKYGYENIQWGSMTEDGAALRAHLDKKYHVERIVVTVPVREKIEALGGTVLQWDGIGEGGVDGYAEFKTPASRDAFVRFLKLRGAGRVDVQTHEDESWVSFQMKVERHVIRSVSERAVAKRRQVQSEQFKNWFGDWEAEPENASKVVNPDTGEPKDSFGIKKVYHGRFVHFDAFSKEKIGEHGTVVGKGFYFAENPDIAEGVLDWVDSEDANAADVTPEVFEAYLNIRKPFDFDEPVTEESVKTLLDGVERYNESTSAKITPNMLDGIKEEFQAAIKYKRRLGMAWRAIRDEVGGKFVNDVIRASGYDGIVHRSKDKYGSPLWSLNDPDDYGRVWIAFEPNQIKSADENQGTFDPASDNVYKAMSWVDSSAGGSLVAPPQQGGAVALRRDRPTVSVKALFDPQEFLRKLRAAAGDVEVPTEAQKESGNYAKGHVTWRGIPITIETARGQERSGRGKDGKPWSVTMTGHYGYIKRSRSEADGDHVDIFVFEDCPECESVFVVDQLAEDGSFDEHKCVVGVPDAEAAERAYLSNYSDGWEGFGAVTEMSLEEFREWLRVGDTSCPVSFTEEDEGRFFGTLGEQLPLVPLEKALGWNKKSAPGSASLPNADRRTGLPDSGCSSARRIGPVAVHPYTPHRGNGGESSSPAARSVSKSPLLSTKDYHIKSGSQVGNKAGVTGRRTDRLGRERCYQDGKLVPCPPRDAPTAREPAFGQASTQQKFDSPFGSASRPIYLMTEEEFAADPPRGFAYDPSLRNEATAEPHRKRTVLGPKFFAMRDAESRRHVLAHEFSHHSGIEEAAFADQAFWDAVQKEHIFGKPDDETGQLPTGINGNTTPGENLTEGYTLLLTEPDWLREHWPRAHDWIRQFAAKLGLPTELRASPPPRARKVKKPEALVRAEAQAASSGAPLALTDARAAAKGIAANVAQWIELMRAQDRLPGPPPAPEEIEQNWLKVFRSRKANEGGKPAFADLDLEQQAAVQEGINSNHRNAAFQKFVARNGVAPVIFRRQEAGRSCAAEWRGAVHVYTSPFWRGEGAEEYRPGQATAGGVGGYAAIIRHEYGHKLFDSLPVERRNEWRLSVPPSEEVERGATSYAAKNAEEAFCEIFALGTDERYRGGLFPDWVDGLIRKQREWLT